VINHIRKDHKTDTIEVIPKYGPIGMIEDYIDPKLS